MGKRALEWLFWKGAVTVADRPNFIRWFDLPERVHPAWVLSETPVEEQQALRRLLRLAVQRCGVGTAADLADYYRMGIWPARQGLSDLVASGDILEVEVEGWSEPAYLDPTPAFPARSGDEPFFRPSIPWSGSDPGIERLFDFRYRIEIYIPRPKRIHGYYVLPFLLETGWSLAWTSSWTGGPTPDGAGQLRRTRHRRPKGLRRTLPRNSWTWPSGWAHGK